MSNTRDAEQSAQGPDKRRVFVVHGRNMAARNAVFAFLRSIDLDPIEWEEAIEMMGEGSPYIGNVLDAAFSRAQAAIVLVTGDDMARLGKKYVTPQDPDYEKRLTRQARPNVIFEMGMAFGKYPKRTVIVDFGSSRPFSDIAGRNTIHFSDTPEGRKKLADRLKNAGCLVRTDYKSDWLTAGDFAMAFHEPDRVAGDSQAGLTITRRRVDPDETATHKPKIWVDIRNDDGACLTIRHLGWIPTPAGIAIKYGPTSMQLKIGGTWCPEKEGMEQLHIPSGESFRLWVQPSQEGGRHDLKDLEQRCQAAGKIGSLALRVDDSDIQIAV